MRDLAPEDTCSPAWEPLGSRENQQVQCSSPCESGRVSTVVTGELPQLAQSCSPRPPGPRWATGINAHLGFNSQ